MFCSKGAEPWGVTGPLLLKHIMNIIILLIKLTCSLILSGFHSNMPVPNPYQHEIETHQHQDTDLRVDSKQVVE
jgi:hypothetical protein